MSLMALRGAQHMQTAGFATPPAAAFTGQSQITTKLNKICTVCYESKKMRFFGSGRAEANLIGRLGRFFFVCGSVLV